VKDKKKKIDSRFHGNDIMGSRDDIMGSRDDIMESGDDIKR